MKKSQTILLIGLRGSGKSTLGRMLAVHLGIHFYDLDKLTLDAMCFETVTQAWELAGKPAFRTAEVKALTDTIGQRCVVALGGGTPMVRGADQVIRSAEALSIYLRGDPALLRDRLIGGVGADRPSLTGADPLDEIDPIFNNRDAIYSAIADHVVKLRAHEQPAETLVRLVGMIG